MRILWLHQFFATPKGWGAVRTYEFARRFCSAGHSVDVVCCAGYDASLTVAGSSAVTVDGIRVYVSGAGYRPHMGFLRRTLSFLQFMAYAVGHVLRKGGEYDVLIASSGPLTLAVPALAGRWFRGLPFVFEVIDVWPDSAIAAGVLKNPVLKALGFKLESWAYAGASAIVTCSTGMTERVEKKLGLSRKACEAFGRAAKPKDRASANVKPGVVTLSNCCDLDQFVPDGEQRRQTRARLNVGDGQTVVLYTGAMGLSNEIADLVEAVRGTAGDPRIVWWFAGDGRFAKELQRLDVGAEGPCRFLGSLAKEQVVALYLAADVNVVTFMHEPLFFENSPNKFFDGIAAGLPAVFNRTTWLEPWLKAYGCGIVCERADAGAEMAGAILGLAADRDRLQRMRAGARRLAEEVFSRDALAAEYLKVLEEIETCKRANVLK